LSNKRQATESVVPKPKATVAKSTVLSQVGLLA
jgi:hypothetical protein